MNISGVSTQIPQIILPELPKNEEPTLNEISETQPTPTQPVDQELEKNENVKGVIRLLQDGHFKGVADIRLRINLSEELNAMENGEIQKVIGEKISAITGGVKENLDALLSSDNLSEEQSTSIFEQIETFTQSVDDLIEENFNSAQSSKEALSSGLSSNFDEFIASLNSRTSEIIDSILLVKASLTLPARILRLTILKKPPDFDVLLTDSKILNSPRL